MYRLVNFQKREKTLDLTARRGVLKNRGFQKQENKKKGENSMILENGATYRFLSREAESDAGTNGKGRSLNVYGTQPTSLANVCLYTSDDSDICQQWVYEEDSEGHKYLKCKGNMDLALDLYTGSSSVVGVRNCNAHAFAPSKTSRIEVEDAGGGDVYIRLSDIEYRNKYLAANAGANGTNSGKSFNSNGNVYFIEFNEGDPMPAWKPIRLDATEPEHPVDPDDGVLTNDVTVSMPANTYLSQLDESTWAGLSDIDDTCPMANRKSSGCGAAAATMVARIMENNSAITTKNLYDWGVWKVSDKGYPWMNWTQNSSSPLTFTFSSAVRNWESAKGIIYDEIMNNRPVVIYLENATVSGTHFVVGYELKAGASRDNLQDSQIMVLNSYPVAGKAGATGTLAEMKSVTKWNYFGSVRRAVKR